MVQRYAIIILLVLTCCKTGYHARRAAYHLSKLDTARAQSITTDSTAREIRFKGVKDNFKFADVPEVPLFLKGKEGIKTKYQKVRDTVYLEVECPDTVVTVYDTKVTTVYEIPPSYKAFIKELFNINNFQFWLIHVVIGLAIILVVARKVFP